MITSSEIKKLQNVCYDMRKDILKMCHNCGSQNGHLGGAMSIVELLAVLYTRHMNIRSILCSGESWDKRDRFVLSKGHGAMAMYAALKQVGVIPRQMIDEKIRGKDSVLYRHPKQNFKYAIECSVGSLGQGIGYAVGMADALKAADSKVRVYTLVGDGECNEGSVWESAMYASHNNLNNLTVIIDKNGLQLDGHTNLICNMDNIAERWKAFGFEIIEIDGHDLEQIDNAFSRTSQTAPIAIIANTVKGKGVSFAENNVDWHDNYLTDELYESANNELDIQYADLVDDFSEKNNESVTAVLVNNDFQQKKQDKILNKYNFDICTETIEKWHDAGYKKIIGEAAKLICKYDESFRLIVSDCGVRIGVIDKEQYLIPLCHIRQAAISEQNMIAMAAGMYDIGINAWAVAYAPFITARVMDQIRVNLAYMKKPVKIVGLLAGLACGDLGSTHVAIEDIAIIRALPNMTIICPSDTTEIMKAFISLQNYEFPTYIRITAPAFDNTLIHKKDYLFDINKAEILEEYGDISIISCGAVLSDVIHVSDELKRHSIQSRIVNMHTIKPIDIEAIEDCLTSKLIVTVEEHSIYGGLGSAVAEILAQYNSKPKHIIIGIKDKFFDADIHRNLIKEAKLDYEGIKTQILEVWRECE